MVVNYHAERGIKLLTDFNRTVTRKEQSFQDLLLSVNKHRKELPKKRRKS